MLSLSITKFSNPAPASTFMKLGQNLCLATATPVFRSCADRPVVYERKCRSSVSRQEDEDYRKQEAVLKATECEVPCTGNVINSSLSSLSSLQGGGFMGEGGPVGEGVWWGEGGGGGGWGEGEGAGDISSTLP